MKRNRLLLFAGIILLIGFFLRFYKLGEVPNGFYQDESAIGYNAYSIIKTGKDEYGKFLPLYFKSFGDYKLPVYIYSTILPIQIFGLNEFAVRFPSAVFGFLSLILFYFFIKELTSDKKLALVGMAFMAVNPWSLHYNRATFEVSICLFLFLAGALLLLKALNSKSKGLFFLGTLAFIISMYAYNLTRLFSPILYIAFLIIYKKKIKNLSRLEILLTLIFSIGLLTPFILSLFQSGGAQSASGTLLFSSAVVKAPLVELRGYFIDMETFSKIFFNSGILFSWQYISNIVSYFSPAFFFVSGSTHGNHGIGNVGQFYIFELPLMLFGVYVLFKEKTKWGVLLFCWAALTILVASLTRDIPHATRSFFLIVPLEIFSAAGLIYLWTLIKNIKRKNLQALVILTIVVFSFYNIVYYFSSYYVRFPILYAKSWRLEDKDVAKFIADNPKYNKVIFDDTAGYIYSSLLFYTKYNPLDFQNSVVRAPDDDEGFSKVLSFGKFEFRKVDWDKDLKTQGTLIVTTTDGKPKDTPPLITYFYPRRPVAFAVKQKVINYPIEEPAYVLVETR